MDIEKTMEFILDQQAKFEAGMVKFEAGLEELRQAQHKTEQGLVRLEKLVEAYAQAGSIQMQLHRERMDAYEAQQREQREEFRAFLKRFDDFLRRGTNGQ
jgi:hypothetical protein